jgi:CDP-diacylglycerol---glycerol-3-phosphate 3-phosphatidyltransferase
MKLSLADKLTLLRLVCLPIVITLFYFQLYFITAFIVTLSCATDYLDGYVARKYNQVSDFGAFLDPVADKITVSTGFIILAVHFGAYISAISVFITVGTIIIILREIAVSALREFMSLKGKRDKVAVSNVGKWKTAFQAGAIVLLIISSGFFEPRWLFYVVLYSGLASMGLAVFLSIYSFFIYLKAVDFN